MPHPKDIRFLVEQGGPRSLRTVTASLAFHARLPVSPREADPVPDGYVQARLSAMIWREIYGDLPNQISEAKALSAYLTGGLSGADGGTRSAVARLTQILDEARRSVRQPHFEFPALPPPVLARCVFCAERRTLVAEGRGRKCLRPSGHSFQAAGPGDPPPTAPGYERELLEVLKRRSFRRGRFRLASGGESDYYLDVRATSVSSEGAGLIGEVLYERVRRWDADAIGGLQVGAVPLVTAAVIAASRHGLGPLEGFWVRDAAKDHGTGNLVEGVLSEGARVVVVEDVCTKGTSALRAVREAVAAGGRVVAVLALVDRLEGAEAAVRAAGVPDYQAVFTVRDFGVTGAV